MSGAAVRVREAIVMGAHVAPFHRFPGDDNGAMVNVAPLQGAAVRVREAIVMGAHVAPFHRFPGDDNGAMVNVAPLPDSNTKTSRQSTMPKIEGGFMTQVDLSVIGQKTEERVFEYDWSNVVLYNLGVGASEKDLAFVYEDAPGGLKVLPSFCVVPAMRAFPHLGDDIEWSLMLHGEQTMKLHRPIPTSGKLIQFGECTDIFDKRKGAVYHVKITGKTEDGEHLYDAQWAIFYLGAGGFGGDPGPKAEKIKPPASVAPDFSISDKVADNQAAIYRLSGDLNPLHLDPEAAKRGGFDKPILHGLCTYGFATRAIVSGPLEGNVDRLKEFKVRFSDPVYPGDTLTTQGWSVDGGYIIRVMAGERVVLTNAMAVVDSA